MTAKPRTLAQMQHCGTAYEVALTYKGQTVVLGYTARKSQHGLLNVARAAKVADMIDAADLDAGCGYFSKTGWHFGSARVAFTGRTERDAASALALAR